MWREKETRLVLAASWDEPGSRLQRLLPLGRVPGGADHQIAGTDREELRGSCPHTTRWRGECKWRITGIN